MILSANLVHKMQTVHVERLKKHKYTKCTKQLYTFSNAEYPDSYVYCLYNFQTFTEGLPGSQTYNKHHVLCEFIMYQSHFKSNNWNDVIIDKIMSV